MRTAILKLPPFSLFQRDSIIEGLVDDEIYGNRVYSRLPIDHGDNPWMWRMSMRE
jgi:hypothetical protein